MQLKLYFPSLSSISLMRHFLITAYYRNEKRGNLFLVNPDKLHFKSFLSINSLPPLNKYTKCKLIIAYFLYLFLNTQQVILDLYLSVDICSPFPQIGTHSKVQIYKQLTLDELNAYYVAHVVPWLSTEKILFDLNSNHVRSEISLSLFHKNISSASSSFQILEHCSFLPWCFSWGKFPRKRRHTVCYGLQYSF